MIARTLGMLAALLGLDRAGLAAQHGSVAPHAVGVRIVNTRDASRPLPETRKPRPLQIVLWYPAAGATGTVMTYRDYVELVASELGAPATAPARAAAVAEVGAPLRSHGVADTLIDHWLSRPMTARRSAAPAPGRFPLVLIANGNGESPHDQAALAELIASHGYVVAATPSPMRISGRMTSEGEVGRRAIEQADDLTFVARVLRREANVDPAGLAIVGHSFGPRGALIMAMRMPVAALVSLDGGIGTSTALASMQCALPRAAAGFHTPILHFYEDLDGFVAPDPALLNSLTATERWLVLVRGMHHHHFTTLGLIGDRDSAIRAATGGDTLTTAMARAVNGAVVGFLDATVGREPAAAARLASGSLFTPFANVIHRGAGEGTPLARPDC